MRTVVLYHDTMGKAISYKGFHLTDSRGQISDGYLHCVVQTVSKS